MRLISAGVSDFSPSELFALVLVRTSSTTIADIVGFTAWSSVRDPTDVFTLLESLYSCFDGIARRLKVRLN